MINLTNISIGVACTAVLASAAILKPSLTHEAVVVEAALAVDTNDELHNVSSVVPYTAELHFASDGTPVQYIEFPEMHIIVKP